MSQPRRAYPEAMPQLTGEIRIAAPLERVFDTAADSRNRAVVQPRHDGCGAVDPRAHRAGDEVSRTHG